MIDPCIAKSQSIALLRSLGIRTIDHLPTLEAPAELSPQSAQAVARRCSVLAHIIMIGYGADPSDSLDSITEFGLLDSTSAHERKLLAKKKPSKQEKINSTWLTEAMQSFGWCLGLVDLNYFAYCDDDLADRFPEPYTDPAKFIRSAALRPFEDIYRQADIHYRLHWAARHNKLPKAPSPKFESAVRERRRALDWVIGLESNWDEVSSDT